MKVYNLPEEDKSQASMDIKLIFGKIVEVSYGTYNRSTRRVRSRSCETASMDEWKN